MLQAPFYTKNRHYSMALAAKGAHSEVQFMVEKLCYKKTTLA